MKQFSNFPSCHCHVQSLDSASTPEAFIKRELELGTGAITVTDHGTLVACRKVYDLGRKAGLTPILGLEGYLRDDNCAILAAAGYRKNNNGAFIGAPKYMHFTVHFLDQKAYECGVRLLSAADARLDEVLARLEPEDRKHGQERKPLFTWDNLAELGGHNVTLGSGCLIGLVQRHILDNNDLATATRYYEKARSLVRPGNFFVEVFPHDCSQNWVEGVFLDVKGDDGKEYSYRWYSGKTVKTDHPKNSETRVDALAKAFATKSNEHTRLLAVKNYRKWDDLPPGVLVNVRQIAEYVPNECRPWAPDGDLQAGCNRVAIALARRYGDRCQVADDSHYSTFHEQIVQDVRLAQGGGSWKFFGSYHRKSSQEAYDYFQAKLGTTEKEFEGWVANSQEWATKFKDFKFVTAPSLPTKFYEEKYPAYAWSLTTKPEDHSLRYTLELIRKHGRMDWTNKAYCDRLAAEIKILHHNGLDLLPYFFIDEEVCSFFEAQGKITGPGRGSAAGLLLAYVLGITHVDPIRFDLSLERFITEDRIRSGKMPDIDQDLPRRDRDLLLDPETGWLKQRFGDHCAQVSIDTTLKLRSAVKDVARALSPNREVPFAIEGLTKQFEMPPMGVSDLDFVLGYDTDEGHVPGSIERDRALIEYVAKYPAQWEIVQKCLGLSRQRGRHPCAYVVANCPISDFIPLTTVGGVRVTSYTAGSVEAVGGLKMDFLGLGALDDIGDAIQLIQARHGHTVALGQYAVVQHSDASVGWSGPGVADRRFSLVLDGKQAPSQYLVPLGGKLHYIWDLPEDQAVFADVALGKTETVFQFNTPGAVQWLGEFAHRKANGNYAVDSLASMATFTALDRPGPLGMMVGDPEHEGDQHNMLVEYARRARGAKPSVDILPIFNDLLPETYGIMVFQENLQRVYQQLTGCSGPEAEEFRSDVAKKQKAKIEKAYLPFIEKAGDRIGKANAEAAWQFFITWAEYGFGKAHAICYAVIGYACAWLKHHYPLEWWTAVLANADKTEVNDKFWRHCGHMIDLPDVKLSGPNFEIQGERIRAPLSLLHGVGEVAHTQLLKYAPYADIHDFCNKIHRHQQETGTYVQKLMAVNETVPNPDTSNKRKKTLKHKVDKEVTVFQAGHNALNRQVVRTLIVSGAMDGLFETTRVVNDTEVSKLVSDYLEEYEAAFAKVTGRRAQPVAAAYLNISPLRRYQRRKGILPAYGEDLGPIVSRLGLSYLANGTMKWRGYGDRVSELAIVNAAQVERLDAATIQDGQQLRVASFAYIQEAEIFSFNKGGKRKEACKITLDIEGQRFRYVKWSGQDGSIQAPFNLPLAGAVVTVVLSRWSTSRPFNIEDLIVIQAPETQEKEAS